MKRLLTFMLPAVLIAVSCGGAGSHSGIQDTTLGYLQQMTRQMDAQEFDAMYRTRQEFGTYLAGLDASADRDVFEGFRAWDEELRERNDPMKAFERIGHCITMGYDNNWTMGFYLMTRVYSVADAIIYDHTPTDDIERCLAFRTNAEAFTRSRFVEMDPAVDRFRAERKRIEEERAQRWETENQIWQGKRIVTATSLGPIALGSSIRDLPNRMEGFYDYMVKTTEFVSYYETDIAWEETHYTAWYAGVRVFDLMTTVRDLDMFDDYEPDENTDWDEIVQFVVYSPEYQTEGGHSLHNTGDELFDAGGVGFHYDSGDKIWHGDGSPSEKEEYTGICLEGLLFRYSDWQVSSTTRTRAENLGFAGYRLERSQMSSSARPKEIYSIAEGWVEQFLENRVPEEESISSASFSDFVLPDSFAY